MKPTIPLFPGKLKTEDFNNVKHGAESECDCTDDMRLLPERGVYCKACEARNILWKIESWNKRL
jgi:hypothetical protein